MKMDKIRMSDHWQPQDENALFSAIVEKINEIVDELNKQKENDPSNANPSN